MVSVPDGFTYPDPPKTLTERVAWALCAHDLQGCEGRLEVLELRALEALVAATERRYGSPKALSDFLGPGGAPAFREIRKFLAIERGMHDKDFSKGLAIFHAHVIRADWPSYMRAAEAAVSVLLERPEAVDAG